MSRPCTCDRCAKGADYRPGEDCHLCWLYWNNPDYREYWDRNDPGWYAATNVQRWPLFARWVARHKEPGDRGLGDTVARVLSRLGADAFKRLYRRLTGGDCGCEDRQAALNQAFPYP